MGGTREGRENTRIRGDREPQRTAGQSEKNQMVSGKREGWEGRQESSGRGGRLAAPIGPLVSARCRYAAVLSVPVSVPVHTSCVRQ